METEDIWNQYQSSLKAFLLSKVSNPTEVDDLLQEIWIKTFKNLKSVRSRDSIKSWLFQIANHAIIDFYRKRERVRDLESEDFWYNKEAPMAIDELSCCVEPFIKALPEESAQLLTVIDIQEQSQKEYAFKQGISYSTLKSRVQKSRAELKSLFEECCVFSRDIMGNITDFESRTGKCHSC